MSRLTTKARRARRWRRRYYDAAAKYAGFLAAVDAAPPRTGKEASHCALLKMRLHRAALLLLWRPQQGGERLDRLALRKVRAALGIAP